MEKLAVSPPEVLIVTHCTRHDIVLGFLAYYQKMELEKNPFNGAMILCGSERLGHSIHPYMEDIMKTYNAPVLYTGENSWTTIQKLRGYTPKLNIHDTTRVQRAASHYESFLKFDALLA